MQRYLSPEQTVGRRLSGIPKPAWEGAVLSFHRYERSRALVTLLGAQPRDAKILSGPHFPEYPRIFEAMVGKTSIALVIALGARADVLVEELAYLGVRWVVASGSAGSLVPDLKKGTQLAAVAALANDGISRAYGATELGISSRLKETLDVVRGKVSVDIAESIAATVEALYREEYGLVDSWRSQGATIINMETSPLYAAATANGLDAIWLGQVSDVLLRDGEWVDWYGDREEARTLSDTIVAEFVREVCSAERR